MAISEIKFYVRIRQSDRPGAVKAYADLRFLLPDGELEVMGFAIIQQPGQKHFVGFPQIRGRNKFFPVVEAKGETRERIVNAILQAFREAGAGE
jgi:DNA-binding cell septation regulator SpoVG